MKYKTLKINGKKTRVLAFENGVRVNVSTAEMERDVEKVLKEADDYEKTGIIHNNK